MKRRLQAFSTRSWLPNTGPAQAGPAQIRIEPRWRQAAGASFCPFSAAAPSVALSVVVPLSAPEQPQLMAQRAAPRRGDVVLCAWILHRRNSQSPAGPVTAVIVVAAGSGQRLGYGMPKAKVPSGRGQHPHPRLARRGGRRDRAADLRCHPPGRHRAAGAVRGLHAGDCGRAHAAPRRRAHGVQVPVVTVVDGGASRADSVRAAMAALLPAVSNPCWSTTPPGHWRRSPSFTGWPRRLAPAPRPSFRSFR